MASQRSTQYSAAPRFSGTPRFTVAPRLTVTPQSQPGPSRSHASASGPSPPVSRATQLGLGLASRGPSSSSSTSRGFAFGRGAAGLGKAGLGGKGKGALKRHVKIQRDSIHGITKGDIRRLARRGGVKRISAIVYSDVRQALKDRLALILRDICAIIDSSGRKTVSVTDVVFALRRRGNPIYGFEPSFLSKR
ncbi:hypothetical protein ACJQWK_08814 [Exserohilum turcicum]|uniref:Histone H4 n=1 Tax=Exserohilum turcicum (strain 28A) TaxID=671987 RepID=R0K1C9_EXST2|nr:uncharacterized protein SETTUDRAFT_135425 [Exserohilum turcica Et28A]EOA86963.1 hypothetical protein SETTUDRAFT_135425 [Exserohilum turcica Et28A]